MDVTVVVATYGGHDWRELAQRAIASVPDGVPVVHSHGRTLHEARNVGLGVTTEFVVYLDADDLLEPDYLEHLAKGSADIRVPMVRYVRNGFVPPPRMPRVSGHEHDCLPACLPYGNWIVVGAAVRTGFIRQLGGWRDFPWSEDWDLWLRCWQAGATIETIPDAVYRAHVRGNSRNRSPDQAAKLAAHQAIARANGVPVPV